MIPQRPALAVGSRAVRPRPAAARPAVPWVEHALARFGCTLRRRAAGWAVLLGAAVLAGCATSLPPEPAERLDGADVALSRAACSEMLARFGAYSDHVVQRYVQTVGARLAAIAPARPGIKLQFTVLDSPGVFAHSFAHGEVVVSRGLLANLNTEAQLAAVLGHEIGHVVSLHSVRLMRTQRREQELEARLAARLGTQQGRDAVSALGLAQVRGYSREHEIEADEWSERLLARAGYDAGAMAQVMRMFLQDEAFWNRRGFELYEIPQTAGGEGVFATHPSSDTRLEQAIRRQGKAAQAAPAPDPNYLDMLRGMVFGLPASYGVQRGSAYTNPAHRMAFTVPPSWYLFAAADRLVAAPRGKDGMLIIRMAPRKADETRRQALEQLAHEYRFDVVTPLETATVRGETAVGRVQKDGETRSVRLAVLDVGDVRLHVAGVVAVGAHWNETDPQFMSLLRSVRAMAEPETKFAKPLRVQILAPGHEPAFTPAVAALADYGRERWELINQIYPQGHMPAGQPIKTIQ